MIARAKNKKDPDKRLKFVLTLIFLLGLAVLVRLVQLMGLEGGRYAALAQAQHQAVIDLPPRRGRIFLADDAGGGEKLYPLATSKDYGRLYAIPGEVEDAPAAADKLFEFFDRTKVEKEVDRLLDQDPFFRAIKDDPGLDEAEKRRREEYRSVKRGLDINERKDRIVLAYREKLEKKGDPYEPLQRKVEPELLPAVDAWGIKGLYHDLELRRFYPEGRVGAHLLGFVSLQDETEQGQYGLEGFFNEELSGRPGRVRAERSARGGLIIINDREYQPPVDGSDLVLTVNRSIEFEACDKLKQAVARHGAEGGSVVVLEPRTGAVLAMCAVPDFDPNNYQDEADINVFNNPVIWSDYEPGSTMKTITLAAALDQGAITPQSTYEDKGYVMVEGWPKPIKNSDYETHGGHGRVDMITVLNLSLNTGAIQAMRLAGAEVFAGYVRDFGFGEKTGIELTTEGLTNIANLNRQTIRPVEAATAAFGQGITATPLQMAAAYAAIANGGILMKPYLVAAIVGADGTRQATVPKEIRRVISERTAFTAAGMLVNVAEDGHSGPAKVGGYWVGAKTGTAQIADKERGGYIEGQTIHSLVGMAPAEDPKFVMLVRIDKPKARFAESTAAPLFGELAQFILDYYKVPKER